MLLRWKQRKVLKVCFMWELKISWSKITPRFLKVVLETRAMPSRETISIDNASLRCLGWSTTLATDFNGRKFVHSCTAMKAAEHTWRKYNWPLLLFPYPTPAGTDKNEGEWTLSVCVLSIEPHLLSYGTLMCPLISTFIGFGLVDWLQLQRWYFLSFQ